MQQLASIINNPSQSKIQFRKSSFSSLHGIYRSHQRWRNISSVGIRESAAECRPNISLYMTVWQARLSRGQDINPLLPQPSDGCTHFRLLDVKYCIKPIAPFKICPSHSRLFSFFSSRFLLITLSIISSRYFTIFLLHSLSLSLSPFHNCLCIISTHLVKRVVGGMGASVVAGIEQAKGLKSRSGGHSPLIFFSSS